jgi:hypothetical protein
MRCRQNFTPLELAVLRTICEMHPADRAALEAQLSTAILRGREITGAGFFARVEVGRDRSPRIGGERLRNGPEAKVDGLEYGMGSILWFQDGYASCLEGFSYEESMMSIDLQSVQFEIVRR